MAVDSPVLERPNERQERRCAVPSRREFLEEDEHNARIRDTYARLINPDSKIEDVFGGVSEEKAAAVEQVEEPVAPVAAQPYLVENARASSALFRADSAINAKKEEAVAVSEPEVSAAPMDEDDEDLRPTPTTIQYQTLGKEKEKTVTSTLDKNAPLFGKREKIIIAVFVAVVVALLVLVLVNSTIIANLNAEIAAVQEKITTVRGAIAGVNAEVEEIINNYVIQ